jgi:hypothetical protein
MNGSATILPADNILDQSRFQLSAIPSCSIMQSIYIYLFNMTPSHSYFTAFDRTDPNHTRVSIQRVTYQNSSLICWRPVLI